MPTLLEEQVHQFRQNFGFYRHNPKHLKMLERVLSLEGPKRWRAAANLYLYLNPVSVVREEGTGRPIKTEDARMVNRHVIADVKRMRYENDLAGNKYASSTDKNSGRRHAFSMPVGVLQFIEMIDPTVLSGTPQERKSSLKALMDTFPEYQVSPKK